MKCSHVEKLLFSGYMDGEIDAEIKKKVDIHLAKCESCRALKQKIMSLAIMPFAGAARYDPPDRVWENIKSSIEREEKESIARRLYEWLKEMFALRKPVFAGVVVMAFFAALILPGVYRGIQNKEISSFLSEEMDFFASLGEENSFSYRDIGIPMEDIFM